MTAVRDGHWATSGGRTFEVRQVNVRRNTWSEVVDGKLAGPTLSPADFDTLEVVRTFGTVAGHEFEVSSAPGDDVHLYSLGVDDGIARELGLSGNRYDGWGGRVPVSAVSAMHEVVSASRARGARR